MNPYKVKLGMRDIETEASVPRDEGAYLEFVTLLIGLQPQLRVFIAHLMPSHDARADIMQEVNMLVWQKRDQFTLGSNFRAWVFTFARNVTMKHQKRARQDSNMVFSPETTDLLAEEYAPEDLGMDERMPALRRCLEKIPADERQLLMSHYTHRGSALKAADNCGRTAAAMRGILFRLRIALRRCVEKELKSGFQSAQ